MRAHLSVFHLISIFPQGQALYFLYFRTPGIEGKLSTYLSTDCLNCLIAETYKLLIEMLPQDPTATSVLFDSVFATTSRWPGLLCWRSRFLPLGMRAESHPSRMGSVLCCYPLRTSSSASLAFPGTSHNSKFNIRAKSLFVINCFIPDIAPVTLFYYLISYS